MSFKSPTNTKVEVSNDVPRVGSFKKFVQERPHSPFPQRIGKAKENQ